MVTSSVDPAAFRARQTAYVPAELAAPGSAAYRPDTRWLAGFLADFAALRRRLQTCAAARAANSDEDIGPTPWQCGVHIHRRACRGVPREHHAHRRVSH